MSNWRIPLSDLDYGDAEKTAVVRVLQSKWLSMGPEVQQFEEAFAAALSVKHAIAVSNGTAALHLAYLALGLGSGDEIIQPAINFVAAGNMSVAVGATPVFADIIQLDEPTIDPAEIKRLLTPRTRAVVVMHYGGYPCRMDEIRALCEPRKIAIIEDACHAVGAQYNQTAVGALGDVACFSFFSNKNLATGEGGMLTTNRDDLAAPLRRLRSHGMTSLTWDRHRGHASSYDVASHGYNYRLDELHAALGGAQLAKLQKNNERRKQRVATYQKLLAGWEGWKVVFGTHAGSSAYHLMVVVAPNADQRAAVVKQLQEHQIQSSLHYPCIPDFTGFEKYRVPGLPQSRAFAKRAITLPLFPGLNDEQVTEICGLIQQSATAVSHG